MDRPSGESNWVMKAGTGSVDPSLIDASKPARSTGLVERAVHVVVDQRDAAQVVGQRVGHLASTPPKTSCNSPTGILGHLLGVDPSRGGVGDGRAEDLDRPAGLGLGRAPAVA